ncbi:MAG: hypothetical protein GXP25_14185, partial [Planctomycetes bacterium]|nr:hypothetical protein [Planctomycetota bacterium]
MRRGTSSWIHRPLKKRSELRAEELERRVAPVTLADQGTFQFTDGDGDVIDIEFRGKGSVTILSGGVDPAGTDITHIDFFNTDGNSRLVLRDANPGAGGDDLTCGVTSSVAFAAMGVLDLQSARVYDTTITMNNLLLQLHIGGMMDNVTVNANSNVRTIVVDGQIDGSAINVSGDLRSFSSLDMVNSSTLDVGGRLTSAAIQGDLDNSSVIAHSQAGSILVSGDMISSAIICFSGSGSVKVAGNVDDSFLESRFGNSRLVYVGGSVSNASVIRAVEGNVGMVYVGGDFTDSTLDCTSTVVNKIQIDGSVLGNTILKPVLGGKITSLNIGGNVIGTDAGDPVHISFQDGIAGSTLIGGYAQWVDINTDSVDHRVLIVRGLMTESTVTAQYGTIGQLQIGGDMYTNVSISGTQETIKDLSIGGDMYGGSIVTINIGSIYRVSVGGDVYGASQPFNGTNASCQSITVGGDMYGAASIIGNNTTLRTVEVRGYMDEAASIETTNGDIFNITVNDGMFDGANITADGGSLFRINVRAQMDQLAGASPFILVDNSGVLGNVLINGLVSGVLIDASDGAADYRSEIRITGDILNSTINVGGG